jgi:hypothetical protein
MGSNLPPPVCRLVPRFELLCGQTPVRCLPGAEDFDLSAFRLRDDLGVLKGE